MRNPATVTRLAQAVFVQARASWRSKPRARFAVGLCLEIHDLAVSKAVAGREKDRGFLRAVVNHGLVDAAVLRARLDETDLSSDLRELAAGRVREALG